MPWAVNIKIKSVFLILTSFYKMTDNETEIQNAAINMIERYGDSALTEVDLRVLELESRNQQEALLLWRDIRKRVELLMIGPGDNVKH